ncbi:MAG: nuclear transport factor 2 family protein [Pseudacidovorax sp.]|nr:nuclear transport factor 2 family protein [Pseudacidovorax sp.]
MNTFSRFACALLVATAVQAPLLATAQAADSAAAKAVKQQTLTQKNKALVMKAYQELFGDHDFGALDRYWGDTYIQHNPYMADGREGVREFVEKMGYFKGPKQKIDFLRVIAEGDLVMVQVRQPASPASPEMVVVDIFRVEKNKIVEHWDVMQAVPADATNKRPMY